MKLKQIISYALAALVLFVVQISFADDALPPLKVGVTPNLPPVIFKQDGKIAGIEADFAQQLGKELKREVKFVEVDWPDQIPALLDGKIDIIMSGMTITKARQFRVNFCAPYLRSGQMALVRRDDYHNYLLGFPMPPPGVIGTEKATTGEFLVEQEFPRSKLKTFSNGEEGAKALKKKKIDLFISDAPTIWWLASANEADGLVAVPIQLTDEQLAWAVNKSNLSLLDDVNRTLIKWQQDGEANQIIKHWLPNLQ
ncbi:MAG TPA: transporter substrate-binding domain-containing protein [Verrucomicrobiae bacterium]|nr:transporter substrate-binding domain-containing protein [Verrucomicrobiae bacterium]